MTRLISLSVLFCAQLSLAAGVKTAPVKVSVTAVSGAAGASYGATSLSLSQTITAAPSVLPTVTPNLAVAPSVAAPQASVSARIQPTVSVNADAAAKPAALPSAVSAQKPSNERRDAATSKASLETLGKDVAGAQQSGASPAAPIARAFDGGFKAAGSAASAVAGNISLSPTHMAGLRHTGGLGGGEGASFEGEKKPAESVQTPAAKPAQPEFEEFDFRRALAGFLVWLMLVGLVVLEYGAIYWAITNAPAPQLTPEEIQALQYGWDGRFPF